MNSFYIRINPALRIGVLACILASAFAAAPVMAQMPPVSEKRALASQLAGKAFSATSLDQFDETFIKSLLAMLSKENKSSILSNIDKIKIIIRADTGQIFLESLSAITDLYEQKFSLEELRAISEFTESPIGKKIEKLSPEFSDKFIQIMLLRFKAGQDDLLKRILDASQHRQ